MQTWLMEQYIKAFTFAAQAHQGQHVPGTELPYIVHVTLVAMEVVAALRSDGFCDQDLAVQCALLHDVIEDTTVTYPQLVQLFGVQVADGVSALTKDTMLDKSVQMIDSLCRIKQQPREIWMVKLADRITNLQSPPPHWPSAKIKHYHEEARRIYDELKSANQVLALRLDLKITAYAQFTNTVLESPVPLSRE